ncbi:MULTISPECIES: hypothetical protein [unclassified Variovorax]|uniref:hypothetical protein n=1 Tax=unclassified Variovorax TaxID=663243 RepID=UPI001BD38A6A|nr:MULTISPECIES: hypothetical protein [unclassified Variovorax]
MKRHTDADTDPGRTREFELLWLLLLLAFALASLSDLLCAPVWPSITEVPTAAEAEGDARQGAFIEPWIPSMPDAPLPQQAQWADRPAEPPPVGRHG